MDGMHDLLRAIESHTTAIAIEQVADIVHVSAETIRRMAVKKQIGGAFKFGGSWRFNQASLGYWLRSAIRSGRRQARRLEKLGPKWLDKEARPTMSLAIEKHWAPNEVAEMWGLSAEMVRMVFRDEPGVLLIGEPSRRVGKKLKRTYMTMRIPQSVLERVHLARSNRSIRR
jgi:excisionase family DNA binding protein